MLLFKALAAISVLVAMVLVDQLAKRLYPERRLRIAVLFGWSPLLFFETVGNGHNDIVMVVCVLAAFALMLRGRAAGRVRLPGHRRCYQICLGLLRTAVAGL